MFINKAIALTAGLILSTLFPTMASAETVMEKVARTGVLTAGTSRDAAPFAYAEKDGKLVGYSVDMLHLIKEHLETQLDKKIKLRLVPLSPEERVSYVNQGKVDIICDATSFTWERDKLVDFSVSYGLTGTQLLVKNNKSFNFETPASLIGRRIAVLARTTNEKAVQRFQPKAELVYFDNRAEAYSALNAGIVDAFASDSILSEAWLQKQKRPQAYTLVPAKPLSREGIACMVPENNSRFLDNVNYSLIKFMQGFINQNPRNVSIFERSFGPKGKVFISQDLRDLAIETMQLVIESREEILERKIQQP